MLDAGLPEIASTGGQAAGHRLCAIIDPQVTAEQRHNEIVMLILVPAGAVP